MSPRPNVFVRPHGWVGADARGEPARLLAWAQRAEELGFDGVLLGDRMLASAAGPKGTVYGASMIEVTTMLSAIAASTERIRLGTLILVFPYRHPVQIAKVTASLDVISDGRLILGAGIGWNRREFDVLGIDPADRGERFEESLTIVRELWTGDPVDFEGKWWTLDGVQVAPRPVQAGGPPVWLASFSPDSTLDWGDELPERAQKVLDRVGRLADGWVPLIYSASSKRRLGADVLASAWQQVQEAAVRSGRARDDIDFVYSDWCYILDGDAGTPEQCQQALSRFFTGTWDDALRTYTIGTPDDVITRVTQHTVRIGRVDSYVFTPLDDTEEQLAALAEHLLPALRH